MTRIDFYILDSVTAQARENFACRLVEKVSNKGHNIFINTQSPQQSESFDKLLWSFKPESFIPHTQYDNQNAKDCSITIGTKQSTNTIMDTDVLVNFNSLVPDYFSQYSRVVEIINKHDDSNSDARTRYLFYKTRGYKMESHTI